MNKNEKKFWQSKLFWLGVLQVTIGVASGIEGNLASGTPLTISGILTIILRVVTKKKIVWK